VAAEQLQTHLAQRDGGFYCVEECEANRVPLQLWLGARSINATQRYSFIVYRTNVSGNPQKDYAAYIHEQQ